MNALPVDPHLYMAYLGAMAVMAFTPGPANVFAIATGMQRGKAAVIQAVAGMNIATLTWFVAAALGLGALVKAFPQVFKLIAVAGALYVAWLGLKALIKAWKPAPAVALAEAEVTTSRSAIVDGFMVQIANPKAILFFTAVLPPFLDPGRPLPAQLAAFACATLTLDILAMSAYGIGGAAIASRMSEPQFRKGFSICVGLLLLSAAMLMATKA